MTHSKYADDVAYLLHSRKYTDSKRILTFISSQHGVFSGVYRLKKRAASPAPFQRYALSLIGTGDLKTIQQLEPEASSLALAERALFCAIYLNELCFRLLDDGNFDSLLFSSYELTLVKLQQAKDKSLQEVLLRRFELLLLEKQGLGINMSQDTDGESINKEAHYKFIAQHGFQRISEHEVIEYPLVDGETLLNIASDEWNGKALKFAKQFCRYSLRPLLGAKPIKARELFT